MQQFGNVIVINTGFVYAVISYCFNYVLLTGNIINIRFWLLTDCMKLQSNLINWTLYIFVWFDVFASISIYREDYLRASRALLREVVRALRHDIDFVALCRGFMKERTETQFRDLDAVIKVWKFYIKLKEKVLIWAIELGLYQWIIRRRGNLLHECMNLYWCYIFSSKERMLLSLADLITMATFLSITPTVKESFSSVSARGEKRGQV